jgi:hypothetical protein
MTTLLTRSRITALVIGAGVALSAPGAHAQNTANNSMFRINPALVQPSTVNINTLNRFATPNLGATSPAFNPYLGSGMLWNGYGTSADGSWYPNPYMYSWNPWGGAFSGWADIINAQGKFMVNREESFGIREQTRQAKIDTRRRLFDEWLYERANTPSLEDIREQDLRMARRRALNDPPFTEILAATSLNTLLDHLKTAQGTGGRGTNVALDEDTLRRVNVTSGAGGNIGLLKNDGFLQWPIPLRAEEFNAERDAITKALPKLVEAASTNGRVDAGTLVETQKNLDKLNERLSDKVGDLGTAQFIESKRYVNFLNQALQALSNENIANYFNQKFSAKGKTVAELVKHMSEKGLRFAPATPGDEAAYRALHQALANYDISLSQNVAEKDSKDRGDPYKDK